MAEASKKNESTEIKSLLEKIQKKLQSAAFTELAILDKMNEKINNKSMEQDNNSDFNQFISKLETDPTQTTQIIAKKLRVAYLYINLDEPSFPDITLPKPTDIKVLKPVTSEADKKAAKDKKAAEELAAKELAAKEKQIAEDKLAAEKELAAKELAAKEKQIAEDKLAAEKLAAAEELAAKEKQVAKNLETAQLAAKETGRNALILGAGPNPQGIEGLRSPSTTADPKGSEEKPL